MQLKSMTDKRLIITLVLDCCFSGSIYRNDSGVRYFPYNLEKDTLWTQGQERPTIYRDYRDVSMLPAWLVDPNGYTILTACGPYEETVGVRFDGQAYGALTYYLLETLKYVNLARPHKYIHSRICAKMQNSNQILNQHPLLYGKKDHGFFGPTGSNEGSAAVQIVKKYDSVLELQAGYAHGIADGDEFALNPFGASVRASTTLMAKVIQSSELTSVLQVIGDTTCRPRTGWQATALTQSRLRDFSVGLDSSLPNQEKWLSAMSRRSLTAHASQEDNRAVFNLVLGTDQQYKILDNSGQQFSNLPSMSWEEMSIDQVCGLLQHLARFTLFRHLTTALPGCEPLHLVKVSICSHRTRYSPESHIEIRDGVVAELSVENKSDSPVYLFVYNLGPSWQVEEIYCGTYYVLQPRNIMRKTLKMDLPSHLRNERWNACENILKVIITMQPTSFETFELPRLNKINWSNAQPSSFTSSGLSRGDECEEANMVRISRERDLESRPWIAMNFFFRILALP